jgi:hypothetical protein
MTPAVCQREQGSSSMATAVASQQKVRTDDIFFPAMALLILGVVVLGFAQPYFLAGRSVWWL